MIEFAIKITTPGGAVIVSRIEKIAPEHYAQFRFDLRSKIGQGNFSVIDEDGDMTILPEEIMKNSIVQLVQTNDVKYSYDVQN